MDSNVHIDPATFQFPNPPRTSIDRDSSQHTHSKCQYPQEVKRLQPRSAGFSVNHRLGEDLKARRLNRQICEELVKGPPNVNQDKQPPPEHRKHTLKTVLSSRSKHKSSKEKKKMPVATHSTSDGRKYRQILSGQTYDSSRNASTYQINKCRYPLDSPASEDQRNHPTASYDFVEDLGSRIHQVEGTEKPVHESSTHKSLETGEARLRMSPYKTVEMPLPTTSESLGNRILADKLVNGNAGVGRIDLNRPKSLTEPATLQSPPWKSTTDDSLGLLRDLSQILSRGETTTLTAGTCQVAVPEAELQPRVRDFAANGSASFSRARTAIRRRSRSPIKRTGKQTEALLPRDRSLNAVVDESQPVILLSRGLDAIIPPPIAAKEPAKPPLAPSLPNTQEQFSRTKISPAINYHSKAPSVVSAESTAEDIQSDASSGVVANAQSAVFVKVPPQPGPAPLTPLPSLPEGLDNFPPATPRASESSHRLTSLESSPPKVLPLPPKSPARSQYKLYPSVDSSPPKRPGSPIKMNAASGPEQIKAQPSPPLRSKRRGISFPRSEYLPTTVSVGTFDELEQWKKERIENTRQKKLQDLARTKSHNAMTEEVKPVTQNTVNSDRHNNGVEKLPNPRDSYKSALFPLKHRAQPSLASNPSDTTTLQYRDSSTLSQKLSQKLSPITVVAEQEPFSPFQRAPSQSSQSSRNTVAEHPQGFQTNGFYPVPPHLASPTLQGPESNLRLMSSHSLPVPRPVASRIPTPHLSPLLRGPSHSIHHSSMHEKGGLEARLSAMERKNAMLEKAFLAVLNASAAFGSDEGLNGIEGTNWDSSSGLCGRNDDRSSRTSGTESLYAGLENLLGLHSGGADARWSTLSG